METFQPTHEKKNPLAAFYRQPKIYVKLPSGGLFYEPGSLDISVAGEYPVFGMTAKDEIMFKTPDALLSGQSTVEVIKSCMPAIVDPWKMPTIDVDFCLISIRIATYGDSMEVGSVCPHCEEDNTFSIVLQGWLDQYYGYEYQSVINVGPLEIHLRPFTYREMSNTAIKTMEQQRIFSIVNDETMSDEDKISKFSESFEKLTDLTVDVVATCISKIVTPDGETSDAVFIKDFIHNCTSDVFDQISKHLSTQKSNLEIKPQQVQCGECNGAYLLPVTMDQSNFFAVRS
jgi:hypothetical protein